MAALTTQYVSPTGLAPTYGAVSASDTLSPGNTLFLHVKNAGGSPDTVTIAGVGTEPYGVSKPNLTVSVPATTGDRMIGPLKAEWFAVNGTITVTHSFTTSVTCAVISF